MTFFAVLTALLLAMTVFAEPVKPTSFNTGPSSTRNLSTTPDRTVNALAGNVTQLTIDAIAITEGWAGYYGNVSGHITLDNAQNETFYNWSLTTLSGEVYATTAASPTWSTIKCANDTEVAAEETALNMNANDPDSVSNTFLNATYHPAFDTGAKQFAADTCFATNAFDATGSQTSKFFNVALSDGSNFIYSTLMNDSVTGFDGGTWDFELLVGEDGHGGDTSPTQYYFFVELG